jgi:hypothetical protein
MNKTIILLADYVNTATDLAELLKEDLKKGREISDKTILALNKFQKSAHALQYVTDDLNKYIIKNN